MADSLAFNKVAGAVLATGLVIFGLQNLTGILFEQAKAPVVKPGYAIAVAEETGGGPAADVIPDWGTVLPKADVAAGQAVTAKCASCHQFDAAGTNNIGPGLYGVVGRAPGTHPGFAYDSAMQDFAKAHNAWTYDELYQFLKNPQGYMPGTKMTFVGLPDPQDRINVIAYLRSNGSTNVPIPAPKPAAAAAAPAGGATNSAEAASNTATPAGTNAANPPGNTPATTATAAVATHKGSE